MNTSASPQFACPTRDAPAIVSNFPTMEISELAEQESWRKEINRPIYHIHKWWATRLGSVFRAIILGALSDQGSDTWRTFYDRHNLSQKIVLDPFMGSGTTLGEAMKLRARAIGCDINPVSTFLVQQAFTRVSEASLRKVFHELEAEVASEVRRYYRTQDPETGQTIPVLYFFWVKTITTPHGEVLPLFSSYAFAKNARPKDKPRARIVCPACWDIFEARYDATHATCSSCGHDFNPQDGPANGRHVVDHNGVSFKIKELLPKDGSPPEHRLYAMLAVRPDGSKVYLPTRDEDQALFHMAQRRLETEELPLPTMPLRSGHNTDQARHYGYAQWRHFFNDRQLLCLGLLLRAILEIEDVAVQEQMLCLFSSTLEYNNLFCSYKGEGTGAVRPIFSNHILKPERAPLENSVWGYGKSSGTFATLFDSRLLRAKRYLDKPFDLKFTRDLFGSRNETERVIASPPLNPIHVSDWAQFLKTDNSLMVLNANSNSLPIPDESIDAVVTDPPYFDFVHYSELSDFFFAWLSPVLRDRYPWMDRSNCSNTGEVQQKDPKHFARHLGQVFQECARVLKSEGILAFTFHHSRGEGWAAIHDAVRRAGLSVVAIHPVHGELRAASPKRAAKEPISLDVILVCQKRSDPVPPAHPAHQDGGEHEGTTDPGELMNRLESTGYKISRGDRFVVAAASELANERSSNVSFEEMAERLERIRHRITSSQASMPAQR